MLALIVIGSMVAAVVMVVVIVCACICGARDDRLAEAARRSFPDAPFVALAQPDAAPVLPHARAASPLPGGARTLFDQAAASGEISQP